MTSVDHGPDSRLSQACKETVPSMSEAGTGVLMPPPFRSTAVSLLSISVETWDAENKQCLLKSASSSLFCSLSSALFGQRFLDTTNFRKAYCSTTECHFY